MFILVWGTIVSSPLSLRAKLERPAPSQKVTPPDLLCMCLEMASCSVLCDHLRFWHEKQPDACPWCFYYCRCLATIDGVVIDMIISIVGISTSTTSTTILLQLLRIIRTMKMTIVVVVGERVGEEIEVVGATQLVKSGKTLWVSRRPWGSITEEVVARARKYRKYR